MRLKEVNSILERYSNLLIHAAIAAIRKQPDLLDAFQTYFIQTPYQNSQLKTDDSALPVAIEHTFNDEVDLTITYIAYAAACGADKTLQAILRNTKTITQGFSRGLLLASQLQPTSDTHLAINSEQLGACFEKKKLLNEVIGDDSVDDAALSEYLANNIKLLSVPKEGYWHTAIIHVLDKSNKQLSAHALRAAAREASALGCES